MNAKVPACIVGFATVLLAGIADLQTRAQGAESAALVRHQDRPDWSGGTNAITGSNRGTAIFWKRFQRGQSAPTQVLKIDDFPRQIGGDVDLLGEISLWIGRKELHAVQMAAAGREISRIKGPVSTETMPLELPALGIRGPAQIRRQGADTIGATECGEEMNFAGPIEGGLWLHLFVRWGATVRMADVRASGAFAGHEAEAEAIVRSVCAPFVPRAKEEVLAFLQSMSFEPGALARAGASGTVAAAPGGMMLQIATEPAAKRELLPDGRDGITLKARLIVPVDAKSAKLDGRTAAVTFSAEGPGREWVDWGESRFDGQWKQVFIQASNPNAVRGPAKPPESITLVARFQEGTEVRSKSVTVKLTPPALLDAKPDVVDFTLNSGQQAPVQVWLENPGPGRWEFSVAYDSKSRAVAVPTVKSVDGMRALVTLKEAGLEPRHDGLNAEVATLRIIATQKGREPVERDILVRVMQEGLFVDALGRDPQTRWFKVAADGRGEPKDVDFRVFAPDPKTGRMENLTQRAETLRAVAVDCLESPHTAAGRLIAAGQLEWKLAGIRPSNQPAGILRLRFAKELPSDGRVVPCDFRISYAGTKDESYTAIVTIGIQTSADGPGGREWQIELERCETIIRKFVPAAYQPRLRELLDRRKQTLGADGLKALRSRIWSIAAKLTLAEGARGYADEERWASYIVETLDWAQWGGDLAFQAAVGSVTGPYGAVGASLLKGMLVSAINSYQDGGTPAEWLWGNLMMIEGVAEGKVVDPDFIQKMGVQSKAKVWAIFVSYHFFKNLAAGETLVNSLKQTLLEVGSDRLGSWLSAEVKLHGQTSAGAWVAGKAGAGANPPTAARGAPLPAAAKGQPPQAGGPAARPVVADAVIQVRAKMRRAPDGRTYANQGDVLSIMRDPSMVRALKTGPADAREAFSNTREAIYRQHDAQVVQHIKDSMPDMKYRMVRVVEFRTPGQDGMSLNTDRDYRVCYYAGRDPQTGNERWIEIPRGHWEDHSYRTFAGLTGGPADDAARAREWASEHQQLATDRSHIEASAAFSDQRTVWNAQTRRFEKVQVTSNLTRVIHDRVNGVDVVDPGSLGQMYVVKVADARFRHEAFVQANKAVETLGAIRESYDENGGRKLGRLPANVEAGMRAVSEVKAALDRDPNHRDPAAIARAERALRESGFSSLSDFMQKLGGQYESLKFMTAVQP
jgi:hypothetical protein